MHLQEMSVTRTNSRFRGFFGKLNYVGPVKIALLPLCEGSGTKVVLGISGGPSGGPGPTSERLWIQSWSAVGH